MISGASLLDYSLIALGYNLVRAKLQHDYGWKVRTNCIICAAIAAWALTSLIMITILSWDKRLLLVVCRNGILILKAELIKRQVLLSLATVAGSLVRNVFVDIYHENPWTRPSTMTASMRRLTVELEEYDNHFSLSDVEQRVPGVTDGGRVKRFVTRSSPLGWLPGMMNTTLSEFFKGSNFETIAFRLETEWKDFDSHVDENNVKYAVEELISSAKDVLDQGQDLEKARARLKKRWPNIEIKWLHCTAEEAAAEQFVQCYLAQGKDLSTIRILLCQKWPHLRDSSRLERLTRDEVLLHNVPLADADSRDPRLPFQITKLPRAKSEERKLVNWYCSCQEARNLGEADCTLQFWS